MYEEIAANKRKSYLLIVAFVLLVIAVGIAFDVVLGWGGIGIAIAAVIAFASAIVSYWKSDSIALSMSKAVPADPTEYAQLHNLVEGLSIAGGLPKPRVYIVDDPSPNAFATGRDPEHAAIAVTTGLLERMNRVELEGVLAHELSHIKNYDILISTISVVLVGTIALLSDIGIRAMFFGGGRRQNSNAGPFALVLVVVSLLLLIASPLIAGLMRAAVSRRRESYADISAVKLTRYPPGLISALEKLNDDRTVVHTASKATAHLWIESPLARNKAEGSFSRINNLFETHPPLEERIQILRDL